MENKYQNWYNLIIDRARNRILDGYLESHHIVPRSLGGNDSSDNLVNLTGREHFVCHILLTKFTKGQARNKMIRAVMLMKASNKNQQRYFNGRLYESLRKEYADIRSEKQKGTGNSFYGKKHSEETRSKMSASKRKLFDSEWVNPHIGMTRSEGTKANISNAKKGKPSLKKGLPQGPLTKEQAQRHKESLQGKCFWWTDGINNIRAAECPVGYKKGRTMSPDHLAKFGNSDYLLKT